MEHRLVLVIGVVASIAGRQFLALAPVESVALTQMAQVDAYQAFHSITARRGFCDASVGRTSVALACSSDMPLTPPLLRECTHTT